MCMESISNLFYRNFHLTSEIDQRRVYFLSVPIVLNAATLLSKPSSPAHYLNPIHENTFKHLAS